MKLLHRISSEEMYLQPSNLLHSSVMFHNGVLVVCVFDLSCSSANKMERISFLNLTDHRESRKNIRIQIVAHFVTPECQKLENIKYQ